MLDARALRPEVFPDRSRPITVPRLARLRRHGIALGTGPVPIVVLSSLLAAVLLTRADAEIVQAPEVTAGTATRCQTEMYPSNQQLAGVLSTQRTTDACAISTYLLQLQAPGDRNPMEQDIPGIRSPDGQTFLPFWPLN